MTEFASLTIIAWTQVVVVDATMGHRKAIAASIRVLPEGPTCLFTKLLQRDAEGNESKILPDFHPAVVVLLRTLPVPGNDLNIASESGTQLPVIAAKGYL